MNFKASTIIRRFVYTVLSFLSILIFWSYIAKIDIVVFCKGRIRPYNIVSQIINKTDGKIVKIYFKDGDYVNAGQKLYDLSVDEYNLKLKKLEVEEQQCLEDLEKDEILLSCILNNCIATKNSNEAVSKALIEYQAYKLKHDRLKIIQDASKRLYDANTKLNSTARLEIDRYKTDYLLDNNASKKYKVDKIVKLRDNINTTKYRIKLIKADKSILTHKINLCRITAPISGTIEVDRQINVNDYLTKGINILCIIPESKDSYKMEMVVDNSDIGKIRTNQKIKYQILTFDYKEYGTMEGEVTKISVDSTSKVYKVIGSVKGMKIIGSNGRIGNLKPGMLFEAKIIVYRKRILVFLFEELNILSEFSVPALY